MPLGGDRPQDRPEYNKPGPRIRDPFVDSLKPKPRIPPVPKAIKKWDKKPPAQKLKEYGFAGAATNDRIVHDYKVDRAKAIALDHAMQVNALNTAKAQPLDPGITARRDARTALDRLKAMPVSKRPKGWVRTMTELEKKADKPVPRSDAIIGALWDKLSSDESKDYFKRRSGEHTSVAGVPTSGLFGDALNTVGKMLAGIPAGVQGLATHPSRGGTDARAMVSDQAHLISMLVNQPPVGSAQRQQWKDYVDQSVEGVLGQYGPGVGFRKSYDLSTQHPLSSLVTGVGTAAAIAYPASAFSALGRGLGVRGAIAATRVPDVPRTFRLRGGERAMGVPVEGTWSRSPLMRGAVQRPLDAASRRIDMDTRGIGRFSESARAAKITRKNLKRDVRREQAVAAKYLHSIGRDADAEELRAVYMRGKPEGMDEDAWLRARLDDVNEMLAGRDMIIPGKNNPTLIKHQRRVARLQKKYDAKAGVVTARTIARKLEPLRTEERSLRAKINMAKQRGEPTADLETRLGDVRDQIAVARGHDVGPVKDSPARNEMRAAMAEAMSPEEVEVAMQVADQFARGANPDNPDAWYRQITSRYAEDPESVGLDAAALLQEAGPRTSLGGTQPVYTPSQVERAFNNGYNVETPDGYRGRITAIDGDTQRATISTPDGMDFTVDYAEIRDPNYHRESPVFYSKAQRLASDLPPKNTPQQVRAFFEKKGVKPVELEWTGFNDWLEALEDSDVKSLSRDEVVDYFNNPLNAFDLNETIWEQSNSQFPTRWGSDRYSGVTVYDTGGQYKELMIQLRGDNVYRSGHIDGLDNPIVQIRFHEINEGGRKIIFIDEMQSDWGASLRGYGYEARPRDAEAQRQKIQAQHTKLSIDLTQRVNEALGITFDEGGLGSADSTYEVRRTLNDLARRMDNDWGEGAGVSPHVRSYVDSAPGSPEVQAYNEWLQTPERLLVARLQRHAERVGKKADALSARESKLINAPADQPYKKTWTLLGLKRMVAYAVNEGYDAVSWPQGIVPAVRYKHVDPGDELTPVGGEMMHGEPEQHSQYPDASNYQRSYVYHETDFADPAQGPTQDVLFGQSDVGRSVDWQGEEHYGQMQHPVGVPMGLTTPARYDAKMLDATALVGELEDGNLAPGMLVYLDSGPMANQFARIVSVDGEGIEVMPSGIKRIEVSGNGDENYSDFEITITDASGSHYLGSSDLASAFTDRYGSRTGEWADIADSQWFDEMETYVDRNWQTELDDDYYQQAVDEFMEQWNNGDIEPEGDEYGDESALYDPQEIADLSVGDYQGLSDLYGKVIPSVAKKEWEKKYGITIDDSYVMGKFTQESRGAISERGRIPTHELHIPPAMAEDVRAGQSFFQTATPVSNSMGVEVKGAVELLGNRRFRLTLFNGADISTVIHELGHVSLHDLDPLSLDTIERDLAGGRSFKGKEWTRDDHERFARAWERFFSDGYASTTSLRRAFGKIMAWMRQVYNGVKAIGDPITPEVARVFEKRLGKLGIDEADRMIPNPELTKWGVLLSHAKSELQAYEARAQIAREKGTDAGIRAEIETNLRKQDAAYKAGDGEMWDRLQAEIDAAEKTLRDRDMLQEARSSRRYKLLSARAKELEKALRNPDSRRYQGATEAADFLQGERETILREVFGDDYDDIFAQRREQESQWLSARGQIAEHELGNAQGFLPYRRPSTMSAKVREAARPLTHRFGSPKTDKLNLNVRNEMLLWQQGDYQADIHVLHDGYIRALAFKAQYDMRQLFHEIGEGVPAEGPNEGWYLIDLDAKPMPREWKSANTPEEINKLLDGLSQDDSQLALSLVRYAENWIHKDPSRAVRPDGGYGNVRQVHPRIIESMMLPYTGPTKANPLVAAAGLANSMARMSLIYANPGYIPSNIIANFVLLVAERGVFAFSDMVAGAHLVAKDSVLFNRILGGRTEGGRRFKVSAELGETHTTSTQRGSQAGTRGVLEQAEGWTAGKLSIVADEWMRAAAWSGIAAKRGYRGHDAQMRLLDAKTEKTRRDRDWVSDKATNAMINFDRLSPWEQRWLRPVLFVWPFIRGSAMWPVDYIMEHPARAGAAVALTQGPGEQNREELGPTPVYYPSMVLVSKDGKVAQAANMGSVNPLGTFGQFAATATAAYESVTGKKAPGPFLNLAGYLAPQYDFFTQLIQGRDSFGNEITTKDLLKGSGGDYLPFVPMTLDILDETKPAIQMDQGMLDTLSRRTLRWTPQKINLAILNQQAKGREAPKTVSQRKDAEIKVARAAWKHVAPTTPMPRVVEQSIESYYAVQELRGQLKDELKKQKDYQPARREPVLTPLQDAAIVYDVFAARFPEMVRGLPDPAEILDKYGEEGVTKYRGNLERALFKGKTVADKARAADKKLKKAGR